MPKIDTKEIYFKFLLRFTVLFLALFGLFYLVTEFYPAFNPSQGLLIFIFIYIVTLGVHFLIVNAGKDDPLKFPMFLIISTVLKLFIYGFFCFWIIYTDRSVADQNIILFFMLYLVTTAFEVISTLGYISIQNKQA